MDPCNRALAEVGSPPTAIRVGLAAGPLVQGNMGSAVKLEYSVVGDTVNLAARLEGSATPGHLLTSSTQLPDPAGFAGPYRVTRRLPIHIKGKQDSIEVTELLPLPR